MCVYICIMQCFFVTNKQGNSETDLTSEFQIIFWFDDHSHGFCKDVGHVITHEDLMTDLMTDISLVTIRVYGYRAIRAAKSSTFLAFQGFTPHRDKEMGLGCQWWTLQDTACQFYRWQKNHDHQCFSCRHEEVMIFPGGRVRKPIAGWKRMPGLGQDHHTVGGRWAWNHLHNFVLFIIYDHDFCRHICLKLT